MYCVRWSNEAATIHADITADHRDVPVFLQYGKRLSQEPHDGHVRFSRRSLNFLEGLMVRFTVHFRQGLTY